MQILINLDKILTQKEVGVEVNSREFPLTFVDENIILDVPLNFGLHQLVVVNKTNLRFAINYVKIGGCNLRKLIYLAWSSTRQEKKLQPCNELWEKDQTWTLPFGYPVSYWTDVIEKKFPANTLGKNLYEDYWIWYPESIILDKNIPTVIRNFFEYNFNFTAVKKKNYNFSEIPFFTLNKNVDKKLIANTYQEVKNNLSLIKNLCTTTSQKIENIQEFGEHHEKEWQVCFLVPPGGDQKYRDLFPECWNLIDSLFTTDIWTAFIGLLPPGAVGYPHMDNLNVFNDHYLPYRGCSQIYIPLSWPTGNFIKFANAGIPDVQSNITVINNDSFVHSVVNTSAELRVVLGIRTSNKNLSNLQEF